MHGLGKVVFRKGKNLYGDQLSVELLIYYFIASLDKRRTLVPFPLSHFTKPVLKHLGACMVSNSGGKDLCKIEGLRYLKAVLFTLKPIEVPTSEFNMLFSLFLASSSCYKSVTHLAHQRMIVIPLQS